MRFLMPALLVPALALAAPALAGDPKAGDAKQEEKSEKAEEKAKPKKICKIMDEGTGSRLKKRVCMTAEQWREYRRSN